MIRAVLISCVSSLSTLAVMILGWRVSPWWWVALPVGYSILVARYVWLGRQIRKYELLESRRNP